MLDVCGNYEHTLNSVVKDEGLPIQTLNVPIEKCKEMCTDHDGCYSITFCSETSPVECHLKTKIVDKNTDQFNEDQTCTTYHVVCTP